MLRGLVVHTLCQFPKFFHVGSIEMRVKGLLAFPARLNTKRPRIFTLLITVYVRATFLFTRFRQNVDEGIFELFFVFRMHMKSQKSVIHIKFPFFKSPLRPLPASYRIPYVMHTACDLPAPVNFGYRPQVNRPVPLVRFSIFQDRFASFLDDDNSSTFRAVR